MLNAHLRYRPDVDEVCSHKRNREDPRRQHQREDAQRHLLTPEGGRFRTRCDHVVVQRED